MQKQEYMAKEVFTCLCETPDHLFIVETNKWDENDKDCLVYFNLNHHLGFWARVKAAFRYVFKLKQSRDHFNCTMLQLEDTDRLIDLLNKYKQF